MSRFFENKQNIHIVAEVLAISGVVYYFSKQTKALSQQILELNKRLDEHEEIIAQQTQLIRQFAPKFSVPPQQPVPKPKPLPPKEEPSFAIVLPPVKEQTVSEEAKEELLDEEIKEELSELDLKKEK